MTFPKGLDVSTYNSVASWDPSGLAFLVARASIGLAKDRMYDAHIAKAKAAGLVTGAYHFNWDGSTPESQAQFFVEAAGDVDLYFLDVEGKTAFTADESRRFIAEVQRLGKTCGLYMSAAVYRWSVGQDYDWVAKWAATEPAGDWEFWQYQGSPKDLDYFNGTVDQLKALVHQQRDTPMAIYERLNTPGTFSVTAGKKAEGLKATDTGFVGSGKFLSSGSGTFDHILHRLSGTGPSYVIHVTSGALSGFYINTGAVNEVLDPAPPPPPDTTPYSEAEVAARVADAIAALKAKIAAL